MKWMKLQFYLITYKLLVERCRLAFVLIYMHCCVCLCHLKTDCILFCTNPRLCLKRLNTHSEMSESKIVLSAILVLVLGASRYNWVLNERRTQHRYGRTNKESLSIYDASCVTIGAQFVCNAIGFIKHYLFCFLFY